MRSLYIFLNFAALGLALGALFAFAHSYIFLAWCCTLLVALSMESRVQLGGRLEHSWLRSLHVGSAIPFFVALTLFTFADHAPFLHFVSIALGIVTLFSGAPLWLSGVESALRRAPTDATLKA